MQAAASHHPRRHQRTQRWLLALLLVAAQWLLPVHLLDHLDDAADGQCDVCLVGHATGLGTVDATPVAAPAPVTGALHAAAVPTPRHLAPPPARQRAPPRIHVPV